VPSQMRLKFRSLILVEVEFSVQRHNHKASFGYYRLLTDSQLE
jgi:hypothetical protein